MVQVEATKTQLNVGKPQLNVTCHQRLCLELLYNKNIYLFGARPVKEGECVCIPTNCAIVREDVTC